MKLLDLFFVIHILQTGVDTHDTTVHVYNEPGGNVILDCSFKENVQWLFKQKDSIGQEKTISDNKDIEETFSIHYAIIYDETYNLQIINASYCTEGRYWCGTKPANETFHFFELRLKAPPSEVRVINVTKEHTIIGREKENLTLACNTLGGIPRGKTIWYHGEKILTMNKDDSTWANFSLLLDTNHNGQMYTCIADHDMLETPLNQTIKLNIMYPPRVQIKWPKRPILVGHSVNLSCSYDSNPLDADILWTKKGKRMSLGNYISTKKAGKSETNLTEVEMMTIDFQGFYNQNIKMLEKVTKVDAGEYTCNVTNTEGSANDTVVLVVQDIDIKRKTTDEPSAILIYIIACCCGVIMVLSSAEMYSCLKSGKLKTFLGKRGKLEMVTINGVTVPLQTDNTVQNEMEMNTTHYMEIDF